MVSGEELLKLNLLMLLITALFTKMVMSQLFTKDVFENDIFNLCAPTQIEAVQDLRPSVNNP